MKDPDHPEPSTSLNRFVRKAQRAVGLLGEVNVRIATNTEMRRLNREFRGKDKPTDVLSFPAAQNGNPSKRRGMPRLYNGAGDIAISMQIARANARMLGHTLEQELKILVLHGLLHLAGYDHESDRGEMSKLEQRLRVELALPTGLIERTNAADRARKRSPRMNAGASTRKASASFASKPSLAPCLRGETGRRSS